VFIEGCNGDVLPLEVGGLMLYPWYFWWNRSVEEPVLNSFEEEVKSSLKWI
jgi:hypothetical protein